MKRLMTIIGLSLILGMTSANIIKAQVNININIDIQPAWGPAGYDYAEYYYIPEIDIYYDVFNRLYWYNNAGRWLSCVFLPQAFCYYDFYSLYKVVLNGVLNPWRFHARHYNLYARYRFNYHQVPIYCMHDARYRIARNNWHGWVEPRYMPHNNGRPQSRDFALNRHEARVSPDRSFDGRTARNDNRTAPDRSEQYSNYTNRSNNNASNRTATETRNAANDTPARNATTRNATADRSDATRNGSASSTANNRSSTTTSNSRSSQNTTANSATASSSRSTASSNTRSASAVNNSNNTNRSTATSRSSEAASSSKSGSRSSSATASSNSRSSSTTSSSNSRSSRAATK